MTTWLETFRCWAEWEANHPDASAEDRAAVQWIVSQPPLDQPSRRPAETRRITREDTDR